MKIAKEETIDLYESFIRKLEEEDFSESFIGEQLALVAHALYRIGVGGQQ